MLAPELKAPRETLKKQIKDMHPSYTTGHLTKLSREGIDHVESILGCFCKVAP